MQFSAEYKNLLDINRILKETNTNNLKVTLKQDPIKGACLYTTKQINKGEVIAFYKMKTVKYHTYKSPTDLVYAFDVYTSKGNESKMLIGDIDLTCIPVPENNIPYWALFTNEPSLTQKINSEIDIATTHNYKQRSYIKEGIYIRYNLIATKDIVPNEEIVMYYGHAYPRNYVLPIIQ